MYGAKPRSLINHVYTTLKLSTNVQIADLLWAQGPNKDGDRIVSRMQVIHHFSELKQTVVDLCAVGDVVSLSTKRVLTGKW